MIEYNKYKTQQQQGKVIMDYKLAKELKDAGFPNIRIGEYFEHRVGSHSDDHGGDSDYPCYCNRDKFPTSDELMDELGDKFYELCYSSKSCGNKENIWIASGPGRSPQIKGKTALEALVKLYIKLNK